MRRFLHWATLSLMVSATAVANAQQHEPITPNYRFNTTRLAYNTSIPSPTDTTSAIGTGITHNTAFADPVMESAPAPAEKVVIPQQGAVDMGAATCSDPVCAAGCDTDACAGDCATSACSTGSCLSGLGSKLRGLAGGCLGGLHGGCSTCGSNSCGGCQLGNILANKIGGGNCCGWFAGLYYMHLWRADDKYGYPVAFPTATPNQAALSSGMARMGDASGFAARIGKMLNQNSAVEFIYWQVFPDDVTVSSQASVVGSTLNSAILFNDLEYDSTAGLGPVPVQDFFTDSQYMSVSRTYDYRNFEVNFLRLPYVFGGQCGNHGARLALLAGVRYFQAEEGLKIFSDDLNEIPGDDPNHELCYFNEMENDLVGFQVGGLMNLQLNSRLSGQFGSKVGIYNNRIRQTTALSGGAGGAIITTGPDAGQPWALTSKKNDVAFLGEFDAGLSYCVNRNWRISGGYKVLAISGYAESVDQIPHTFNNLSTAGLSHGDDSLILHGIYAGIERTW